MRSCILIGFAAGFFVLNSCTDSFLEVEPKGGLDEIVLQSEDGIDALLIGAYSMLEGVSEQGFGWETSSSNWLFGSVRRMEANKGSDAGDSSPLNPIQAYNETSENPIINLEWRSLYEAISRCNGVIFIAVKALNNGTINQSQYNLFIQQARALRG